MIAVRPTAEGDLPGLDALFRASFGHGFAADEWEWKYRRLPGEGRSLVAVDGAGAVVAHAGALRLPACRGEAEAGIWQLADFAGTTGGAGGGLVPPLVRCGRALLAGLPGPADLPWIFGFPSARHFRLGERAFGYRPLAEVRPLAGPLPAVDEPRPGVAAPAERLDPGDDLAERAWAACAVDGVVRTTAFLNWRYHDRPARYYRYYRLAAAGAEGLAVFAFVGRAAWAAELWLPPAGGWYDALVAAAADLRAAGLESWRFWPPRPGCGLDATLARLGLAPEAETLFVGCRGAPGGADPVVAAAGFYYAMGDYDAV
jgi:hypothetical protein